MSQPANVEGRSRGLVPAIAALSLIAAVAIAAPARAAVSISALTAAPVSAQAGGHSNFTVHIAFDHTSNTEHPNSLVLHLPAGLIGNPTAATPCSVATFTARKCPASAAVGTSSIAATATPVLAPLPTAITASGKIYVLQHAPNETARLGIDLFPDGTAATLSPHAILSQSVVSVRTTDGGLDSTLVGLPETADTTVGSANVTLNSLSLTLNANASGGPFETNPTSCGANTTSVDVVSYEDPTHVAHGSGAFTTTGCDQLRYAPTVSVVTSGGTRPNQKPSISATVLQGPGQAASKRVTLTLPGEIEGDFAHLLAVACKGQQFLDNACPNTSIVGQATAQTPLLPISLTGAVYLVQPPTGSPQLRVTLAPLGITVTASTTLDLTTTFDNLPDTPLSSFKLEFPGGKNGIFMVEKNLCTGATPIAKGSFLGQNGAAVTLTSAAHVQGCPPAVAVRLRRAGTRRASLSLTARSVRGGPALTSIRLTLPKTLRLAKNLKSSRRSVSPNVGATIRRVSARVATITLPKTGANKVSVTIGGGAVHGSRHGSQRIAVRTTDTTHAIVNQRVKVQLAR